MHTAGVNAFQFGQAQVTAVPEPSSLISAGLAGLFGLGAAWCRRRATKATA